MLLKLSNYSQLVRRLGRISLAFVFLSLLAGCEGPDERKAKYLNSGKALFDEGKFVKAELEFKNVLQLDPNNTEALFMLGQVMENKSEWKSAFSLYSHVLKLNPRHLAALVRRGNLFRLAGQTSEALEAAKAVLTVDPLNLNALVLRSATRSQLGALEPAIKDARKVLRLDPTNVEAFSLILGMLAAKGEMHKAIFLTETAMEQRPDNVGLYQLLAHFYNQTGDSARTEELLEEIVNLKPDDLVSRFRLSAYHFHKGNQKKAELVLRDAVEDLPESNDAKLLLVNYVNETRGATEAERELLAFLNQNPDEHQLRFILVEVYRALNQTDKVKEVYTEIIRRDNFGSYGLRARIRLAHLLTSERRFDAAIELLDTVLKVDPMNADALLVRAFLAKTQMRPNEVIKYARAVLNNNFEDVQAMRLLANGYRQKNEIAKAREILTEAIALEADDLGATLDLAQLLMETGETIESLQVIKRLLQQVPDNYNALRILGLLQRQLQKWDGLEETAQRLKRHHPDNQLGFYFSGLSRSGKGQFTQSIQEYEQALTRQALAIEPRLELAKSYLGLEQTQEALKTLQQADAKIANNARLLSLRGEILLQLRRLTEAEATFKQAIDQDPRLSTPYRKLAELHLDNKDTAKAVDILNQGIGAVAWDLPLRFQLAAVHLQSNNPDAAAQEYELILERMPTSVTAANNLAMLLVQDNPDQTGLDRALELAKRFKNANKPTYLDTLGWVYFQRGEYDRAIPFLEKAVNYDTSSPEHEYHLAMAYLRTGRTDAARTWLRKALNSGETFPGAPEALQALGLDAPSISADSR